MNRIVFINPSPNTDQAAAYLKGLGKEVVNVCTKDFIRHSSGSLWSCISGDFKVLNGETAGKIEPDPLINALKKPFFTYFKNKHIKSRLAQINPEMDNGTFQDSVLLTCPVQAYPRQECTEYACFEDVHSAYPDSIIATTYLPSNSGKTHLTKWRTDYSLAEALREDAFFIFNRKGRHMMYREGDILITVSDSKPKAESVKNLNPSFQKFAFEPVESKSFHVNCCCWINKMSSRVFLLNDYSWNGFFVKMGDQWAKSLAKSLCIKQDNKK